MSGSWVRSIAAVGVWALLAWRLWPLPLSAQESRAVGPGASSRVQQTPTELDQQRAEVTREELRDLMQRYPPALGRVLKLDPTLHVELRVPRAISGARDLPAAPSGGASLPGLFPQFRGRHELLRTSRRRKSRCDEMP